jgi:cell division protein FtsN
MAKDYAKMTKKKSSRKSGSKRRSAGPWAWLLMGMLIGLVLGAVAYLKITMLPDHPKEQAAKKAPVTTAKAETKAKAKEPIVAKAPASPKFDFYTLLPEMEVAVPESVPKAKIAQTPLVLPHPLENAQYRLQLASYKRHAEADGLKAKLALSGQVVEIHSVKLENGEVWYRVYTPLIPSREQALSLQKDLQNQAISSMLLRDRES